jgi:hypothetical protein
MRFIRTLVPLALAVMLVLSSSAQSAPTRTVEERLSALEADVTTLRATVSALQAEVSAHRGVESAGRVEPSDPTRVTLDKSASVETRRLYVEWCMIWIALERARAQLRAALDATIEPNDDPKRVEFVNWWRTSAEDIRKGAVAGCLEAENAFRESEKKDRAPR